MVKKHYSDHSSDQDDGPSSTEESSRGSDYSDSGSDSDGSSRPRHHEKRRHEDEDEDQEALIGSHHRGKHARRQQKDGGLPSWAMYLAIGLVVAALLGGAWYFLLGPGADDSTSESSSSSSATSGGGAVGATGATGATGAAETTGGTAAASGKTRQSSGGAVATGGGGSSSGGSGSASGSATASAPASSSTGSTGGGDTGDVWIAGFWENYQDAQGIADIPYDKCELMWFVAKLGSDAKLDFGETEQYKTADFVSKCQAAGTKALFTIGGWTSSNYFTSVLASSDLRGTFISNIKAAFDADKWDGMDLDWEYPGAAGDTQDFDLKNDLPNFLLFFQELRKAVGDDVLITTDTSSAPWLDPTSGSPSTDLSAFAATVNKFTVMTYDAWGSGETTGPNYPYDSKCNPSGSAYSVPSAMQGWIDAGVPANQLLYGAPFYGHSWTVDSFDSTGAAAKASSPVFQVASGSNGAVTYAAVVAAGADDAVQDDCTYSMYLQAEKTFTVYDNAATTTKKASVCKNLGLGGVIAFAIDGDVDNELRDAMAAGCS